MKTAAFRFVLKLGVVAIAIWVLFQTDLVSVDHFSLREGATAMVLPAFALVALQMILLHIRFWFIIGALSIPIPLFRVVSVGMATWFLNAALLGGFGFLSGDAIRAIYLFGDTDKRAAIVGAGVFDRLVGLIGLVSLTAFGIYLSLGTVLMGEAGSLTTWLTGAIALCVLGLGLVVVLSRMLVGYRDSPGDSLMAKVLRQAALATEVFNQLSSTGAGRRAFAITFLITVAAQFCAILAIFLLGKTIAVAIEPTFLDTLRAAPAAMLTSALPLPAGGIGFGEAAFAYMLHGNTAAASASGAAVVYLSYRAVMLGSSILGLPFFLANSKRKSVFQD